jgi:hypothetical protein
MPGDAMMTQNGEKLEKERRTPGKLGYSRRRRERKERSRQAKENSANPNDRQNIILLYFSHVLRHQKFSY